MNAEDPTPELPISYRPELPDWGVYLRWPCAGEAWIHPEDLELALQLIPSRRVFRRSKWDGTHYWLHYGEHTIRVEPSLWINVPEVDLGVGQQVELLSSFGENDPGILWIADIFYLPESKEVEFYLRRDELRIARSFRRPDLKPLQVHYHLRAGDYQHPPSATPLPPDIELLDVGDLQGSQSSTLKAFKNKAQGKRDER